MQDALAQLYPWMHVVGRMLFALIFVASGISHLTNLDGMGAYAEMKGVKPGKPAVLVSGLMIIAGGLMVALGWHRFIGAGLIVLFLVPTAFLMHAFWKETDAGAKANEMAHFLKDLALAGAALFIAVYGGASWPMSLGG